jgi:hypothetical protein
MIPNGYAVIVISEPIRGFPSHRIYGPFPDRDTATEEGKALLRRQPDLSAVVLPIRPTDTLANESP